MKRFRSDEDFVICARIFQARGDVDCVTHDRVILARLRADRSCDDGAGVDADM